MKTVEKENHAVVPWQPNCHLCYLTTTEMKATVLFCLIVGVFFALATSSVRSAPQKFERQVLEETSTQTTERNNKRKYSERIAIADSRLCLSGYYRDFLGKCRKTL